MLISELETDVCAHECVNGHGLVMDLCRPRCSPDKGDELPRRRWNFYEAVKVANTKNLLILLGLARRDRGGARS